MDWKVSVKKTEIKLLQLASAIAVVLVLHASHEIILKYNLNGVE